MKPQPEPKIEILKKSSVNNIRRVVNQNYSMQPAGSQSISVEPTPKKGFRTEKLGSPFPNFVLRKHEVPSICRCIHDGDDFYVINSNDMHILNHNGSFGVSSLTHRSPSYDDSSFLMKPYYVRKIARDKKEVSVGLKKSCIKLIDPSELPLSKNKEPCEKHGPHCQSCTFFKISINSSNKRHIDSPFDVTISDCEESRMQTNIGQWNEWRQDLPENLNLNCNIDEEKLILMPEEAIFLSFGVGCLTIHNSRGEPIGYKKVWKRLVESNPEFPIAYAVYHYFRSKNWVPKLGNLYGASYLLYKIGPSAFHASYLVHILGFPSQPVPTWNELHTWIRLGSHVSKNVLLCEVSLPRRFDAVSSEPRSIFEMSLKETSLFRWKATSGTAVKF